MREVERLAQVERAATDLRLAQWIALAFHEPTRLEEETARLMAQVRPRPLLDAERARRDELVAFYQRVARRKNAAEAHGR